MLNVVVVTAEQISANRLKMLQLARLHRIPFGKFDRESAFPLPPKLMPYGTIIGGTAVSFNSNALNSMLWGLPELDVYLACLVMEC